MLPVLLWLVFGYLLGSIPGAYLTARILKGIDIRQYGSGNVGGANVMEHVGPWAILPVAVIDVGKSLLPTYLALRLGYPVETAAATGVAAVAGHCWSVYLSFTGGRGMATALGALLLLFPMGPAMIVVVHFIGSAFRHAPLADLVALCALAPAALWLTGSHVLLWQAIAILLIAVAKRLHANSLPLPEDPQERRAVLMRRLLYDRDVPPDQPWTNRKPPNRDAGAE